MAEIEEPASEADLSFEVRWRKALEQPEVSVADAKKIVIDVSPSAILGHLRQIADASHGDGGLTARGRVAIMSGADELERAFETLAPTRLQELLGTLKAKVKRGTSE